MKKLIKFLSAFIPNKKLRHKFREKYAQYILQKELSYIESEEGKKELEKIEKEFPKVLSIKETVKEIINNKKSICRFGDGELNLLLENKKSAAIFQERSDKLKNRLIEVITSEDESILICISPFKNNKKYINKKIEKEFPKYMERYWLSNWKFLKPVFNKRYYGNALISRVDMFYECPLNEVQKIWGGGERYSFCL